MTEIKRKASVERAPVDRWHVRADCILYPHFALQMAVAKERCLSVVAITLCYDYN